MKLLRVGEIDYYGLIVMTFSIVDTVASVVNNLLAEAD